MGIDAQTTAEAQAWLLLPPEGRRRMDPGRNRAMLNGGCLLAVSTAGGALAARITGTGRKRR